MYVQELQLADNMKGFFSKDTYTQLVYIERDMVRLHVPYTSTVVIPARSH